MKVHPDTIKPTLTKYQRILPSTNKPVPVTSTAYPLVDARGKSIKIGDEVAVCKDRDRLCYFKIKGILEKTMMIYENIPTLHQSSTGISTRWSRQEYLCDAVTYILVLDSKMSIKRPSTEVLLLA